MNGDTLVARITPCLENGKTAFVDFLDRGQVGWGSTEYIVLRPHPWLPPEYGYYLARSAHFRSYAIKNMVGSSGRQRVPADSITKFSLVFPLSDIAARFGTAARPIMHRIRSNMDETRILARLRDTLLPKLISGEIQTESAPEPHRRGLTDAN